MTFSRQMAEWAYFPDAIRQNRPITNPAELFRCRSVTELLLACDADRREIGDSGSDYGYFSAFCESLPLLRGNATAGSVLCLLQHAFPEAPELSFENRNAFWKYACKQLQSNPGKGGAFLPQGTFWCLYGAEELPIRNPAPNLLPVLHAGTLLPETGMSLSAWEAETERILAAFASAGCRKILFPLSPEYRFVRPDPHHAALAIEKNRRTPEERALLRTQLFRQLCLACGARNWLLIPDFRCSAPEAVGLLSCFLRTGELPELCWSAADASTRNLLLQFSLHTTGTILRPVLLHSDAPEKNAFSEMQNRTAAKYPAGRICIASGYGLPDFAQSGECESLKQPGETL